MSKRQVANIAGQVEYKPGQRHQVANIAGQAEYKPGQYRQVANIAGQVEYTPGAYRQVANVAVQIEYVPCNPDVNDPRYEEWEFYYSRLAILSVVHGRNIDLSKWCGAPYDNLPAMKQLFIDETRAAIVHILGPALPYDPGVIE